MADAKGVTPPALQAGRANMHSDRSIGMADSSTIVYGKFRVRPCPNPARLEGSQDGGGPCCKTPGRATAPVQRTIHHGRCEGAPSPSKNPCLVSHHGRMRSTISCRHLKLLVLIRAAIISVVARLAEVHRDMPYGPGYVHAADQASPSPCA